MKKNLMNKWLTVLAFIITLSNIETIEVLAKDNDETIEEQTNIMNVLDVSKAALNDEGIKSALQYEQDFVQCSKTGFPEQYVLLNQILQGFYEIYGKEEFHRLASSNFIPNMSLEFQSIGVCEQDFVTFVQNINHLNSFAQKETTSFLSLEEEMQKDQSTIEIAELFIKVYENKANEPFQNNKRIQAVLFAMLQGIDLESYSVSEDLVNLLQNPNFLSEYSLDLKNVSNFKVAIDSDNENWKGDFCFTFQNLAWTYENNPDTFFYALDESDKLINIKSYNSIEENQREYLKAYGITEEEDISFCLNNPFFVAYEAGINNCFLLDENDKLTAMKNFMNFCNLHQHFFENETSRDILQVVFSKAIKSCKTREQVFDLIRNEAVLYTLGGSEYQSVLTSYGITNLEEQKFYIQNIALFNHFLTIIKRHQINIQSEQKYIKLFKTYLENNEILTEMSLEESKNYLNDLLYNKSLGEIYVILDSNIELKRNDTMRRRVIYAYA